MTPSPTGFPEVPENLDLPAAVVETEGALPEDNLPATTTQGSTPAMILPQEEFMLIDTDALTNRVNDVMDLQKIAMDALKTSMAQSMAQDPGIALDFFRETTSGAVKMVDLARKVGESKAKAAALAATGNRGGTPTRPQNPASPTALPVKRPTEGDTPKVAPIPDAPIPGAPEEPVAEPGDLSSTRFDGVGDF